MNRILVVEDNLDIAMPLMNQLKAADYSTFFCESGNQVISMINQHHPDLVLLDLELPSLKTFEVCENIRQSSNLPIIMMSAKANHQERIKGFSLGVDDFINKPFSLPELLLRIKSVLKRAS